jgi:hypothetical protein
MEPLDGVADMEGLEVIKGKSRSEAALARRIAWYRDRRARADGPLDDVYAAFELLRGHIKHVADDDAGQLARQFIAFAENAVATTTTGRA